MAKIAYMLEGSDTVVMFNPENRPVLSKSKRIIRYQEYFPINKMEFVPFKKEMFGIAKSKNVQVDVNLN